MSNEIWCIRILSRGFALAYVISTGYAVCRKQKSLCFNKRRQITMTKLYHPAIYAQLLAARQELAEAYEQNEVEHTLNLSAFIDRLQLEHWAECCLENAC